MDIVLSREKELIQTTNPLASFPKSEVEQSIPERFEKIVQQYPDELAIKQGEISLTYIELNQAANRLAHAILAYQKTSELPVAFLLRHGISPVIAILGILKAGKFL